MSKLKNILFLLLLGAVLAMSFVSCTEGGQIATDEQSDYTPLSSQTPTVTPMADIILVNSWRPIPEDYQVDVRPLANGQKVAAACYDDLDAMLAACAEAGMMPEVCSGFRTIKYQENLYEDKVKRVMREGHRREDAELIAATEVARPGTSEHHTGLAVDIIDKDYPVLDETQEQRPTQQWLLENSWRYGFVLRYPTGKTDLTGIIYEPWHYRYVGKDAAKIMYEQDLCLEEYLELYQS